jgi:hypothetical protein
MLAEASKHVEAARKMREHVNQVANDAKPDVIHNIPKQSRRYSLIGYYCQNMSAPHFGSERPGATSNFHH